MTVKPRSTYAYTTSTAPMYDSRLSHLRVWSSALGIEKSCYVYVPPDVQRDGVLRVPSLYLLRGHEREWVNRLEDGTRGGRTVLDVYEDLRVRGAVGPLILVFPGISSDDNRLPGLLMNWRAPELAAGVQGVGSGRWEDYFMHDLIPSVDSHFPTISDGQRRGIGGFSLGGLMAIKIAAQHPNMFGSASAYDGTFLYANKDGRTVRRSDHILRNPIFAPAWNEPRDYDFIATNNPANLILGADLRALRRIRWMVQYGPESGEPWSSNFYRGEHLLGCLRSRGIDSALSPAALPDGDHSWRTADRHMGRALPLHWEALKA